MQYYQLSDVPGGIPYKAENYHSAIGEILASEGIPPWVVAVWLGPRPFVRPVPARPSPPVKQKNAFELGVLMLN